MSKQAKVIYVSDDECEVSLNVGERDGVSEGDKFLIYSLSDHEIIDPDTNESLGFLEFVKGTGKVTHVQKKMCTVTSTKYKNPSPQKTVTKHSSNTLVAALGGSITEETVIHGDAEQIPFSSPNEGDLAKRI